MELGERKLLILQAIIDDYITTAVPVGSRTISKKYSMGLSSATIRNEMSDLEDLGYLDQPHTSAGRIPSDKAYRLYVDQMMKVAKLTQPETNRMKLYVDRRISEVEEVMQQTAKVLSELTNYTSIVLAPQFNKVKIEHVQLVPINPGIALVVIVTDSGILKDSMIRVPEAISSDQLHQISKMLTEKIKDHTLDDIDLFLENDIQNDIFLHREFFKSVIGALSRSIRFSDEKDIILGGTANMFNYPEYNDIEKAKAFLSLLEDKGILHQLLSKSDNFKVCITIGSENEYGKIKDFSIVTATYRMGTHTFGSIGVIGPTRMKYSNVVAILDHMRMRLSEMLTKLNS